MRNSDYQARLGDVAHMIEILGGNSFRSRAFARAAREVGRYGGDLNELIERGELSKLSGVGKSIAADLVEMHKTGSFALYDELAAKLPEHILDLVQIQGLGPKKVKALWEELGVDSLEALKEALEGDSISKLSGFGAKSQQNIKRELERLERQSGRTPLPRALEIALPIVEHLRGLESVVAADVAGSARRRRESVGDLDFVVASDAPEAVMAAFVSMDDVVEVMAHGSRKSTVVLAGDLSADLRVVPPALYGSALHHFTGSKEHHVALRTRAKAKGLKISEYGVFRVDDGEEAEPIASASEEEVYAALGLRFIPPELREAAGEIELASEGELPALLELGDIRGDLHMHTTASDGRHSIAEMAQAAMARGYSYIVITDHSKSSVVANGLDEARLRRHMEAIDAVDAEIDGIRVLKGIEVDILRDGSLDLEHELLDELDFVIGSVHSSMKLSKDEMTARVVAAIASGHIHLLGHPTGRKLGGRDGYELDLEAVIAACLEHRVALEINASAGRLDLNDAHARMAAEAGVMIAINTDSHSVGGFEQMHFGVSMGRRAWLTPEQVLNTRPWAEIEAWKQG